MFELRSLHTEVDSLGARCLQLRPGLQDLDLWGNPLVIAVGRELQGRLESGNSQIQQLFLRIEPVQDKIIDGQLTMDTEPRGFEIRGTRLGAGDVRFHIVANPSPDIEFVRRIQGQLIVGARGRRGILPRRRTVLGLTRTGDYGWTCDRREQGRPRHADGRAGAA